MSAFHVDEAGDGRLVVVLVDQSLLDQGYSDIGGSLRLDLTNDEAADLYDQLGRQIGQWVSERREARSAVASGVTLDEYARREMERLTWAPTPDDAKALALDDPKHPDYADRLREYGDTSRKEARENG